jgi:hypothetical protein
MEEPDPVRMHITVDDNGNVSEFIIDGKNVEQKLGDRNKVGRLINSSFSIERGVEDGVDTGERTATFVINYVL